MGLNDRLPSLPPSAVHASHVLFFALTTLFLVLPAVTGPTTNFWWLTITFPVPGSTGPGSQWHLGGLGVCKIGEECLEDPQNVPDVWGQVRSTLIYHFAAAAMFAVVALVEYGLLVRPGSKPICTAWTTLALLIAGPLIVITAMAADLGVWSQLVKKDTIEKVETQPVFWLSVVATCFSILWSLTVYRVRQLRYDKTAKAFADAERQARREQRAKAAEKERKTVNRSGLRGLWPW